MKLVLFFVVGVGFVILGDVLIEFVTVKSDNLIVRLLELCVFFFFSSFQCYIQIETIYIQKYVVDLPPLFLNTLLTTDNFNK